MKLNTKNLGTGFLYFYIHYVTELVCFFVLGKYMESTPVMWLLFFTYDMLAFVPQGVIGYISDKFPKIPFGLMGLGLLGAALVLQNTVPLPFLSLTVLCLGNAFIHVNGAEVTLRTSNGSLSHSAIFVSGGSFGVISGKLLAKTDIPFWILLFVIVSAIPFVILAQMYLKKATAENKTPCKAFRHVNPKANSVLIIVLAVIVVAVRGYMGYGIPTSWDKTTMQTVFLFVSMGIGKAAGGILADLFGVKRVALLSVLFALPLLMFGDNHMFISLFGVMLFSMTMSITLSLLVSVLPEAPGLAFGLTTIGLFIGTAPVFFYKITSLTANCIMLSVMTAICLVCLIVSVRKDGVNE